MISKNALLIYFALIFLGLGLLLIFQLKDLGKFRLIACDVGQGDGLLLITPGGSQIVVDGGPGKKILDCLSRYMPFWDRKVELMVSTHPQQDHLEGLVAILGNYKVDTIATTGATNNTQTFFAWHEASVKSGAKIYVPKAGDRLIVDKLVLEVLWPPADKLFEWGNVPPSDLNENMVVLRISYGGFCAYLTGDVPKEILERVINKQSFSANRECQVLKISHHGSTTGTSQKVLDEIKPQLAIIQVGAKNQFGHPHKATLDILESSGVKILRNDLNGEIEVDSDGKSFSVKSLK